MKKLCVLLLLLCLLTGCASPQSQPEYKPYIGAVVETYCPEHQASTEIAVKDGQVYCAYLEDVDGKEQYVLDVFENNTWQRVETVTMSVYDHPLFLNRLSYDPLKETVGKHTLYTDEKYTLYLNEQGSNVHYELFGGGEGLRRVATDRQNTVAVLTSDMINIDGVPMAKLYIYTLE